MKHLRSIIAGLVALLAIAVAPTTTAQKLTPEQMVMAVEAFNKQLPMEIAEGISIDKMEVNDESTLLTITFKTNPKKMGITLEEAMAEIGSGDIHEFLGDDAEELFKVFDCDIDIVIEFPDTSSKTVSLKRK